MQKVIHTRNQIITFEIVLLVVMLLISYKIKTLQSNLLILSKERVEMLFSIHRLGHETKDLTSLSRNYVLTGDIDFRNKYFNIEKKGYGLIKEVKNSDLYKHIHNLPFSKSEIEIIDNVFRDFHQLATYQREALNLFENNNKKEAVKILFSKNYKNLEYKNISLLKQIIKKLDKRMEILSQQQSKKIKYYFILLATIGTLFVIINIYFYVYLTNIAVRQLSEKEKLIKKVENFNNLLEETVQRRTHKIQQLMKVKSEFLANMSHEIRTPLNAMFGFIRILQEKDFDAESSKYLSIIEKSGKNLLTIINDILDFSKIEAGKLNIEKVEFNPKEEIDIIHNLFKGIASEKDINLEINENLKYKIISDPVRIKQVIANLLSNAIKFSKSDTKILLNINYNDKTQKLYVEVIDEGIGIAEDKLIHIFDAFSQADNSTTRKYGGTGLGLTISHKLIELLGGELKVESELGKGSKFYFTIPAQATTEIIEEKIEKKDSISQNQFSGYMLLVEDNKANQMFMKVILDKMDIEFDIANDGLEAIEKFKEFKYDVILMDENMPNMNGIVATKKIREFEKEKHLDHTPIIALTANAMEGDRERFIKAGMDFYLSKPLEIEKLQSILEKI